LFDPGGTTISNIFLPNVKSPLSQRLLHQQNQVSSPHVTTSSDEIDYDNNIDVLPVLDTPAYPQFKQVSPQDPVCVNYHTKTLNTHANNDNNRADADTTADENFAAGDDFPKYMILAPPTNTPTDSPTFIPPMTISVMLTILPNTANIIYKKPTMEPTKTPTMIPSTTLTRHPAKQTTIFT
jgi:hypothetical protein